MADNTWPEDRIRATEVQAWIKSMLDTDAEPVGPLQVLASDSSSVAAVFSIRLYGAAQEVARFMHQLRLIRQAAQLVRDTDGSEVAIQHLSDLMAQLAELDTPVPPRKTELIIDEDERAQPSDFAAGDPDFELDPARVRPNWTRR